MIKNWWLFIKERFPLGPHLTMVFVFTGFNFLVGSHLVNSHQIDKQEALPLFALAFVLCLSFFFRLRLFDEIKDYEFDKIHNPTRPLARGLLKVSTVFKVIILLSVVEVFVAASISKFTLITQITAIAYSFLMYKEFFIGKFIRPHLTTYAIMHTFVSVFLGFSLVSIVGQITWFNFHPNFLVLGLVNWCFFNIFEFARKTFAPIEEKPKVDSYSKLFGVWGAIALSLSQAVLALFILRRLEFFSKPEMSNQWLAVGFIALISFSFGVKPTKGTAKAFRNFWSLFIILFYVLMSYQIVY